MICKNEKAQLYLGNTFCAFRGNIFKPIDVKPPCFCLYACESPMIISSRLTTALASVALISPNDSVNVDCGDNQVLVLYLSPKWASVLLEKHGGVVTDFSRNVAGLISKIYQQLENPCTGTQLKSLEYLLDQLQMTLSGGQVVDQRTIQAIKMLENNSEKNFRINEIAEELNLSLGGFCNLFKRKTGVSARTLRLWIRCVCVVKSVGFSSDPTEAVMDQGFSDYAQFSRIFKMFVGTSPCTIRSLYNGVAITHSMNES